MEPGSSVTLWIVKKVLFLLAESPFRQSASWMWGINNQTWCTLSADHKRAC